MAQFLITHVNSIFNKGDAAIAAGIIKTLRSHHPNCKITVLSATPSEDAEYYSKFNVSTYERLFNTLGRKRSRMRMIGMLIEFLFRACLYLLWTKIKFPLNGATQTILKLFQDADVIIVGGGGSYGGGKRNTIFVALFPIVLAKMLGKTVMIYSPSVEPFTSKIVKIFTKWAFSKADLITVREEYSAEVLKKLKVDRPVFATADPAFLAGCEPREVGFALLEEAGVPANAKLRIGMTIKNGPVPSDPSVETPYQRYFEAHVSAIEKILVEKDDSVVVLFNTSIQYQFTNFDDDRIISQQVRNMVGEELRGRVFILTKNYTPEETKAMIGTMDIFVATRTHSAIFAMTMNVPLVAISYEYKTNGILRMMGLEDRVLDINTLDKETLIASIHKLIEERESIGQTIRERLPIVQALASRNGQLLMGLMNGTKAS